MNEPLMTIELIKALWDRKAKIFKQAISLINDHIKRKVIKAKTLLLETGNIYDLEAAMQRWNKVMF